MFSILAKVDRRDLRLITATISGDLRDHTAYSFRRSNEHMCEEDGRRVVHDGKASALPSRALPFSQLAPSA